MSPGVPQDTTLLDLHTDGSSSMLRAARRDSAPGHSQPRDGIDRAVGGHLSLAKRNSTPVGGGGGLGMGMGVGVGVVGRGGTGGSGGGTNGTMEHRRLDRCHSEPVKSGGNSSRYKTELCRPFEEHGFCKYGDKCQFAHGSAELRTLSRHPKYKTELCRTFHTIGFCPYGPRCHFIHNADERRGSPAAPTSPSPVPAPPLSPRPHILAMAGLGGSGMGLGSSLGSTAESPSPPASLHGSPTSPSAFFDDAFTLFPGRSRGLLEGLTVGLHGLTATTPAASSPGGSLPGLETPPVSPVESLAGDLDSLSLSSSHSTSPTPHTHTHSHALDLSRSLRLPIFEQLCEHD